MKGGFGSEQSLVRFRATRRVDKAAETESLLTASQEQRRGGGTDEKLLLLAASAAYPEVR